MYQKIIPIQNATNLHSRRTKHVQPLTELQTLYWDSQKIYDKLVALEYKIHVNDVKGRNSARLHEKYGLVMDELQKIKKRMELLESTAVS